TGLLDLAALDVDVVDHDALPPDEPRQIESERRDVALQLRIRLLEGHENARLAELHGTAHEELGGEQRLPATRGAAHQRGSPMWQSAPRDLVETLDACRALEQASGLGDGLGTGGQLPN